MLLSRMYGTPLIYRLGPSIFRTSFMIKFNSVCENVCLHSKPFSSYKHLLHHEIENTRPRTVEQLELVPSVLKCLRIVAKRCYTLLHSGKYDPTYVQKLEFKMS